ncbi:hypothetical protein BJ508DRAFT_337062, partial [Ascobolus immersus RN42]
SSHPESITRRPDTPPSLRSSPVSSSKIDEGAEYLQWLDEECSYEERSSPGGEDNDGTASLPAANPSPAYMPLADVPPGFRRTATCIRTAGLAEGPYSVLPGFRQIVKALGNHGFEVVADNEQHDTRSFDLFPLALADREVLLGAATLFERVLEGQAALPQPTPPAPPRAEPHQPSSPSPPPASLVPEAAQEAPEAVSTSPSRSATPAPPPALPQQPVIPLQQVTPAPVTPAPGSATPATPRRYRLRSVLRDAGIERSEVRLFYGSPRGQIEIGTPERDLWEDEE